MTLQAQLPPSSSKRSALEVHTELAAVLNEHIGGWADTEALGKVQRLCSRLRDSRNVALSEKAHSIEQTASILYSERKHSRYNGGVQAVRGFLWNDMTSLWIVIDGME